MSGVVVDSSAWIEWFAGRTSALLEDALMQGLIVLPPIVVAELVSGAHKPRDRAALVSFLMELPLHETPPAHWVRVGELRRLCREKGISISTPDAHVAQCALDRDALLLTYDDVFSRMQRYSKLRLAAGLQP